MNDGQHGNGLDASAPGAAAAPGWPGSPAAGAADSTARPARILILEDETWDAERAQSLLTSAGLDFTSVVVATRALFAEQLDSFRPDVILSDYHLPGFSGEAALAIAQEQCPDVPFIIWSGVLGDEAAVALIKQGATDYVLKDRPARLPSVIGRALAEAEQRTRLADLDEQLREAQRLASLGHLGAAEQAMRLTRELLAAARQEVTTAAPRS
jgi:two-component system sensor histidine kinase/response regulator